ncbi:MAG: hypothetical protein IH944_06885 [Armatimonadetes bacterium]|nr:hypothetical protein [Armatimonadota bacterium]
MTRHNLFALRAISLATVTIACGLCAAQDDAAEHARARLKSAVPKIQFLMSGESVSRVYGARFGYGFSPEQAAEEFIAEYGEVFEPGEGHFVMAGTQQVMRGKFTAVYFDQYLDSMRVEDAYLTVLVLNDGVSSALLASSASKKVQNPLGGLKVNAARAQRIAQRAKPGLDVKTVPYLVIYQGEASTHRAWKVTLTSDDLANPARWIAYVDTATGQILDWKDEIRYADINGHVDAWHTPGLKPNQPNNPPALTSLPLLRVNVVGGSSALTDFLGDFTISNSGATTVTVEARLQGPWARVVNRAGANEVLSQNVTPPGPVNFVFNAARVQFNQAQVDGFLHTTLIHNFVKDIEPTYPGVDFAITVNVNINSNCNAYFNGSSINFYTAGGGCPNTAYSTVVQHEYGHLIVSRGHPGASGDYHEGMADVTAALASNTPLLAEDFRGQDTGALRSSYNSVAYPCSGSVHRCGQVLSGAFWLTKDELDVTMGPAAALAHTRMLYLNSILLHPSGINPGVTIDVLILDDDDGDLLNGTPHYDEIADGFGAKGLDAPPLEWVKIRPVTVLPEFIDLDLVGNLLPVVFDISDGVGQLDVTTIRLHWRLNRGTWNESPMFQLTNGITAGPVAPRFYGAIPTPPCGSSLEWFVSAADFQGRVNLWPKDETLESIVGHSLETIFFDTFERSLGWTVTDFNLATGSWVRAAPNASFLNGRMANPGFDSDDAGSMCLFTGNAAVGAPVGTNDVDGGPTRLTSPVFDLSGGNGVIEYKRWFFNDDGDDSLVVEISNNGGATWTLVRTVMYGGSQNAWLDAEIIVGNYVTPSSTVQVRFSTADNPNNSITEAAIDAFRVLAVRCE